jgi:lipid A disaccharide synthetase
MKFILYTFMAAAVGRACAKEAAMVAEKEVAVAARGAEGAVVKSGTRATEVAISRAAMISLRNYTKEMNKESKYVSFDSTTNTFTISNIK